MNRDELEDLASEKQTTPEALLALMNDQAWFEQIFVECNYPHKSRFEVMTAGADDADQLLHR